MRIEWERGRGAQRGNGCKAKRDVRNKAAIHDVEVNAIDARRLRALHRLAQRAKVGIQDACSDLDLRGHVALSGRSGPEAAIGVVVRRPCSAAALA